MDTARDQDPFYALIDQLCTTWNRPPANDAMRQAYWSALKDARLSEVKANVARILRTATRKDPFPKPAELRDVAPQDQPNGQAFEAGERAAVAYLEELRKSDIKAWEHEVRLRRADRILATEPQGSVIYAEALREWRHLRGIP